MLKRNIPLWALATFLLIELIGAAGPAQQHLQAQAYSLPNVNSGCPTSCRQITWQTGSDIWNGGSLPTYTSVTCTGLAGNGTTDDGPAIQACINALSKNQCAYLPAGGYLVNSTVRLKSYTCLRGAKAEGSPPFMPIPDAAATRIILGSGEWMTTQNFSPGAGSIYPTATYATFPTNNCFLAGSPTKGDTTETINSSGSCNVSVGSWLEIYGNDDPNLMTATGTDGHCDWCGNNNGYYLQQQIVQVTAMNGSGGAGTVVTLSKPLYYTPQTASETVPGAGGNGSYTEPAGAKYSIVTFPTTEAGYENLRFDGSQNDIVATQVILLQGCLYCWVRNVETFDTGSSSGSAHVEMDWGYGDEVRDSAFHDQRSGASGSGYGVYFQFVNTDAKVENNIFFHNRHSVVYQGGGSGTAILYNYLDDMYTDDLSYLGSARTSHGAHPYFNLFEGNIISHIAADDFWGTSSHDVFFRNWMWGGESNYTFASGISLASFPPEEGYNAVDLYTGQSYYSYVDNVLGNTALSILSGTNALWSAASVMTFNEYSEALNPTVYSLGGQLTLGGANAPSSSSTVLLQGNYDFKTMGVAYNQGSASASYQPSYYYSLKPSFIGSCPWPAQGSDLTPVSTLSQPAYQRAMGLSACGSSTTGPAAPIDVQGSVTTVTSTGTTGNATKTTGTPAATSTTPATITTPQK
jgi:hypothetical protein